MPPLLMDLPRLRTSNSETRADASGWRCRGSWSQALEMISLSSRREELSQTPNRLWTVFLGHTEQSCNLGIPQSDKEPQLHDLSLFGILSFQLPQRVMNPRH